MKRLITSIAVLSLAIGGLTLVGCESSKPLPPGENGNNAGGNGAFGETPNKPGRYDNSTPSDPSNMNPSGNSTNTPANPSGK